MSSAHESGAVRIAAPMERWAPVLVLALTAAAYAGVVRAGFVWDDLGLVVANRYTGSLANIPQFFAMDLWDTALSEEAVSGYYRPLTLVSLALDRAMFAGRAANGLWAPGHHLHNLAWHLCSVGLLYWFLLRRVGWRGAAGAALVFGLHPVQSEAVVWVSARNDPMATGLLLGSLLCLDGRPAAGRLLVGGLLALAALLTKESAVLIPGFLLFMDLARGRPGPWPRYGVLLCAVGVALIMRAAAGVGSATWPSALGWQLLAEKAPDLVSEWALVLVWPWPLSGATALEWLDPPAWRVLGGLAVVVTAAGAALWTRRRLVLTGLGLALLALLPTAIPIADKALVGDRYLYLPMVGLMLAVSGALRDRTLWLGVALAGPYLAVLHARLPDWVNEVSIWEAAVRDQPSPYTHGSLGIALQNNDRCAEALSHLYLALDAVPGNSEACPGLVTCALRTQGPRRALELGTWAVEERGCPLDGRMIGGLATAHAWLGEWELAREQLTRGPGDRRARIVEAALLRLDEDEEAFDAMFWSWDGIEPLDVEVERLLARSRVHSGEGR